jgi:aminopeptidase N
MALPLLDGTSKSISEDYDKTAFTATLNFSEEIKPSKDASLVIDFTGTIGDTMSGFYRSKYKPIVPAAASVAKDDEHHYMFSTQFEACDARRAFPCFDEPNLKATFGVEIEIPEDLVALSNMPEKETKKGKKEGTKIVSFEKTPIMSTYVRPLNLRLREEGKTKRGSSNADSHVAARVGDWRFYLRRVRDHPEVQWQDPSCSRLHY